jgi:hypothetical protein
MQIEQYFGQLVARFGIMWRTLKESLHSISRIVLSIFLIHNFLKDGNENALTTSRQKYLQTKYAFNAWCGNFVTERAEVQGRRRDLENSSLRDELTNLFNPELIQDHNFRKDKCSMRRKF